MHSGVNSVFYMCCSKPEIKDINLYFVSEKLIPLLQQPLLLLFMLKDDTQWTLSWAFMLMETSTVVQILYMAPRIEMRVPPVFSHMVLSTSCRSCKFP